MCLIIGRVAVILYTNTILCTMPLGVHFSTHLRGSTKLQILQYVLLLSSKYLPNQIADDILRIYALLR